MQMHNVATNQQLSTHHLTNMQKSAIQALNGQIETQDMLKGPK